jgi:hypothetical protein
MINSSGFGIAKGDNLKHSYALIRASPAPVKRKLEAKQSISKNLIKEMSGKSQYTIFATIIFV